MDEQEKRIDLNSELGMSRRDLLRRGAIVGGTLLWVAPAIQSMAPKAFAVGEGGEGSALCTACQTNIVDDGPGGQPPVVTHTVYNPTPECCACLNTPHSINYCSGSSGGFVCVPISGQEDLPNACPPVD